MPQTPIAIVGAAARFPGAHSLDDYWRLLIEGRHAISTVPAERWSHARFGHPDPHQPGRSYTFAAGVLEDHDLFDAEVFGISRREAEQMDPQQRWLLELAWQAIQDAGLTASWLSASDTGVYIGAAGNEYGSLRQGDPAAGDAYFMTGINTSIAANRLSYLFDLHGPSLTLDTACSSSLIALHMACEDLRRGRTGAAIAGGVNILLTPYPFIGFARASMLSPDGRCFAFDARANGYVRAEGAGVVVLKRLDDALRDGDPIRGVVVGSGVNTDGRTMGLALPSLSAQSTLLRGLYEEIEIDPERLAFIEAHGTGTAAGDPVELQALGDILGRRRLRALPIGSAKTNVGHLEVASGMAGLFKAMLALEHGVVPASLNFETPNPRIDFAGLNLQVVVEPTSLAADASFAGVNAFGFGGANSHVVLSRPPARAPAPDGGCQPSLLLVSARSREALSTLSTAWADRLEGATPEQAGALLRGAARRRDHHGRRIAIWGESAAEIAAGLREDGNGSFHRADGIAVSGRTAFVFSGNGSQWIGMGREAYACSPVFRDAILRVDAALYPHLGWSVRQRLLEEDDPKVAERTDVAQPLLFTVQVAIVDSLCDVGVIPDLVAGHSVGELAAAWVAGALTLDAACKVVAARSRRQQETQGMGRMAALGLAPDDARALLAELDIGLELSAENSDAAVTVGGDAHAIAVLGDRARTEGWSFTQLPLDYAFHTAFLDPVRNDLLADLHGLEVQAGDIPIFSSVEGRALSGSAFDALYWWRNIREPVRFRQAVNGLIQAGARVFVEIGPHPILQSYIRHQLHVAETEGRVLSTLKRSGAGSGDPFRQLATKLYVAGSDLGAAPMYDGAIQHDLPQHPLKRERFWFRPTGEGSYSHQWITDHPLLGQRINAESMQWSGLLDHASHPWLFDHAVEGVSVLPGAAIVEMALAAGRALHPKAATLEVRDLDLLQAVVVENGRTVETRFSVGDHGRFRLEARHRLAEENWSLKAAGRLAEGHGAPDTDRIEVAGDFEVQQAAIYALASRLGLDYGPGFRVVWALDIQNGDAARVTFDQAVPALPVGEIIGPERLDGALQGFLGLAFGRGDKLKVGESLLPERFGRICAYAPFGATPTEARVLLTSEGVRSVCGRLSLHDVHGRTLLEADDCVFRRVQLSRLVELNDKVVRFQLTAAPLRPRATSIDLVAALSTAIPAANEADETRLLFEASLVSMVSKVVRDLARSQTFSLAELVAEGKLPASSRVRFEAALNLLRQHSLAEEADGCWMLCADAAFSDSDAIWRAAMDEAPEAIAELVLASNIETSLAASMKMGVEEFPPHLIGFVEHALYWSGAGRAALDGLCKAVAAIAKSWPIDRPLRVLEIEAGPATKRLIRALAPAADRLVYEKSSSKDAEVDEARFDLIVTAYGLSRTNALPDLKRRLLPGGVVLSVELAPALFWDLLFGAEQTNGRSSTFPVAISPLSGPAWCSRLQQNGFSDPVAMPASSAIWSSLLIGARRAETEAAPQTCDVATPLNVSGVGGAIERALPLSAALDDCASVVVIAEDDGRTAAERITSALASIRAQAQQGTNAPITLVVRGAWTDPFDPVAAALWGAGRTLVNETAGLDLRLLDIAPGLADAAAATAVREEIDMDDGEREVIRRRDGRFVLRLRRGLPPTDVPADSAVALNVSRPGLLDSLVWSQIETPSPGPGDIAIKVAASGLNFRDVMWAQGILPEEALHGGFAGATLGLECAGVVAAIGPGVKDFAPGDRVMALAPAALASHVVTRAAAAVHLPNSISFVQGATLPVAFLTVVYSLGELARLEPGESVLVHGAAGAVGLAAVQFAQARGAKVFATAGSPLKRGFLNRLGVEHVLDSRGLAFADAVLRLTAGKGVDVVLNTLSGEAMARSMTLLKPFGRFLELGKRDFYADTHVGLRALRKNISYFAVDTDRLPRERPELAARLLRDVSSMIEQGAMRPLPYSVFERHEIVEAFRLMQASGHVGKVVIRPDAAASSLPNPRTFSIRPDRPYVVTGGLTGFGLAAAKWLVARGARKLALIGRRGEQTPGGLQALADLAALGADARAYACDVTNKTALCSTLEQIRTDLGPIAGVLHAAAVIADGLLDTLREVDLAAVLGPKIEGGEHLDALTRQDPIELFVLFSSATTVLGAPGQGAYVAANMALEALAYRRVAENLPALAVGWGPIADVGLLAGDDHARESLSRRLAVSSFLAQDALDALPALWESGVPSCGYVDIQWEAMRRRLPVFSSPTFGDVLTGGEASDDINLAARLKAMPVAEALATVQSILIDELAKILSAPADRIESHQALSELGMDSLMAVELRLSLEGRLRINLPLLSLSEGATVAGLASRIVRTLTGQAAAVAEARLRHEGDLTEVDPPRLETEGAPDRAMAG